MNIQLRTRLFYSIIVFFTQPDKAKSLTIEKHFHSLISWVEQEDGFVSKNLEIRRKNTSHTNTFDKNIWMDHFDDDSLFEDDLIALSTESTFGIFATSDFKEDEIIMEIPGTLLIEDDDEDDDKNECSHARYFAKQMRLRNESKYAPYINFILGTQPPGKLPSAWSEAGKNLLRHVLKMNKNEIRGLLPPSNAVSWIDNDWYGICNGSDDPIEKYAYLTSVQRNWNEKLIPLVDMLNHRNGHWLNTYGRNLNSDDSDEPITLYALRDIVAGEEIYISYNKCENCFLQQGAFEYGTPELLRDNGFVEQFPQSWAFEDIDVSFEIEETEHNTSIKWIGYEPNVDDVELLKDKLIVLEQTKKTIATVNPANIPEYEWNTIRKYVDAMIFAIESAIEEYEFDGKCIDEGTCVADLGRYDELDKIPPPYPIDSDTYESYDTCIDQHINPLEIMDNGTMNTLETIESPYQKISFDWDPKNKNTCMSLDDTVQICDSYRPHYHEMIVHETARYLNSITRVLFVGGGDSMILYEVLKYPDLELVVGLELDQRVVRGSFKHFGTQPHFDDERVEWWFGDASKSLRMLPKEYFGSFDMVLVDLSETVMSFKVTESLDVLETLTLLVNPEGIFVKNEVYIEKFKQIFPYSAQIIW